MLTSTELVINKSYQTSSHFHTSFLELSFYPTAVFDIMCCNMKLSLEAVVELCMLTGQHQHLITTPTALLRPVYSLSLTVCPHQHYFLFAVNIHAAWHGPKRHQCVNKHVLVSSFISQFFIYFSVLGCHRTSRNTFIASSTIAVRHARGRPPTLKCSSPCCLSNVAASSARAWHCDGHWHHTDRSLWVCSWRGCEWVCPGARMWRVVFADGGQRTMLTVFLEQQQQQQQQRVNPRSKLASGKH